MDSASSVLGGASVLRAADVDVGKARERRRQRRLARLAVLLSVACAPAWWRALSGRPLIPLAGVSLGPAAARAEPARQPPRRRPVAGPRSGVGSRRR
jgi:hypothetical protein